MEEFNDNKSTIQNGMSCNQQSKWQFPQLADAALLYDDLILARVKLSDIMLHIPIIKDNLVVLEPYEEEKHRRELLNACNGKHTICEMFLSKMSTVYKIF